MENNTITISAEAYTAYIENQIKLDLIKKAVKDDGRSYDFFDSSTCEKIRFILGEANDEGV